MTQLCTSILNVYFISGEALSFVRDQLNYGTRLPSQQYHSEEFVKEFNKIKLINKFLQNVNKNIPIGLIVLISILQT